MTSNYHSSMVEKLLEQKEIVLPSYLDKLSSEEFEVLEEEDFSQDLDEEKLDRSVYQKSASKDFHFSQHSDRTSVNFENRESKVKDKELEKEFSKLLLKGKNPKTIEKIFNKKFDKDRVHDFFKFMSSDLKKKVANSEKLTIRSAKEAIETYKSHKRFLPRSYINKFIKETNNKNFIDKYNEFVKGASSSWIKKSHKKINSSQINRRQVSTDQERLISDGKNKVASLNMIFKTKKNEILTNSLVFARQTLSFLKVSTKLEEMYGTKLANFSLKFIEKQIKLAISKFTKNSSKARIDASGKDLDRTVKKSNFKELFSKEVSRFYRLGFNSRQIFSKVSNKFPTKPITETLVESSLIRVINSCRVINASLKGKCNITAAWFRNNFDLTKNFLVKANLKCSGCQTSSYNCEMSQTGFPIIAKENPFDKKVFAKQMGIYKQSKVKPKRKKVAEVNVSEFGSINFEDTDLNYSYK